MGVVGVVGIVRVVRIVGVAGVAGVVGVVGVVKGSLGILLPTILRVAAEDLSTKRWDRTDAETREMKRFWRVGSAQNAVFP